MKEKILENKEKIIIILLGIFFFTIRPIIAFWLGYFLGWISKIFMGELLINGLTYLHIRPPLFVLPRITGTISWIASFFAPISFKINNKNLS